jgi:phosphatidylserine/phosphatidylglycerophosphate/cardiolipin synthase-like enzyme
MTSPLRLLGPQARRDLATALKAGRLGPPFTELGLRRYVGGQLSGPLAVELARLVALGLTGELLVEILGLLDADAEVAPELVWTGPDAVGAETRDTGVVLRELFGGAQRRVLVAGYAVHQGKQVFEVLAERMMELPELRVELFLNVARRHGDTSAADALLYEFATRFRKLDWPGERLPTVYFDPRSVAEPGKKRAVLHAKCVVVDDAQVFVTSANFTEAAQERNIEAGVLLRDTAFARALVTQFERLVAGGHLKSVPGL